MDISYNAKKDLGRELRLSNWFEGGKRERWEEWSTREDTEPINRRSPLKRSPFRRHGTDGGNVKTDSRKKLKRLTR